MGNILPVNFLTKAIYYISKSVSVPLGLKVLGRLNLILRSFIKMLFLMLVFVDAL